MMAISNRVMKTMKGNCLVNFSFTRKPPPNTDMAPFLRFLLFSFLSFCSSMAYFLSAILSLALRALGLRSISSSDGTMGLRVMIV